MGGGAGGIPIGFVIYKSNPNWGCSKTLLWYPLVYDEREDCPLVDDDDDDDDETFLSSRLHK